MITTGNEEGAASQGPFPTSFVPTRMEVVTRMTEMMIRMTEMEDGLESKMRVFGVSTSVMEMMSWIIFFQEPEDSPETCNMSQGPVDLEIISFNPRCLGQFQQNIGSLVWFGW